ncbi:hypothetical protein [Actinocrispum wychmicini]|uniref:Excreted virulence factor EspC (Type VII ESX diderm) n=1 Tax=Actinocrispum wychmicini TaxID=1213861 RepID=A0A4R2JBM5_9PSEU|nr:hypothetical protein [Actinocrispum wychmicini]TCO54108.1 hypothetical protein EV192_10988 [Actinocrispum wychmicini]
MYGFTVDLAALHAAGQQAHELSDALRAHDPDAVSVAATDVGHTGLAQAIAGFTARCRDSMADFVARGEQTGRNFIESAVRYGETEQAGAERFAAIMRGDQHG